MHGYYDALTEIVAVVTGASRGIGEVIAQRLARENAIVVLMGRDEVRLTAAVKRITDAGGQAYALTLDVTDASRVQRRFQEIIDQFGAIDLLVNNAGNMGPLGNTWEVNEDQWWETINIHLRGGFLCMQEALKWMIPHRQGRVINIVSHAGIYRWPTASAYSVAKAALIKLTENVAVEAKDSNVKVFALHPGIVIGAGLVSNLSATQAIEGSAHANLLAWVEKERLAGRSVSPSQSATQVLKLASGNYDALNGRYLTVYDDFATLLAQAPLIRYSDALTLRLKPIDFSDPLDN